MLVARYLDGYQRTLYRRLDRSSVPRSDLHVTDLAHTLSKPSTLRHGPLLSSFPPRSHTTLHGILIYTHVSIMARLKRILKYFWFRVLRYLTNRPAPSIVEFRSKEQLADYMYSVEGQSRFNRTVQRLGVTNQGVSAYRA